MKKLAYFFVGCVIIGLAISMLLSSFPVFTAIGRGFLMSVGNEQYEQAYSMFSDNFKQQTPFPVFKQKVIEYGLNDYESVTWKREVVDPDKTHAFISGLVKTKSNRQLIVEFELIAYKTNKQLDAGWRIDGLFVKEAEAAPEPQTAPTQPNP